MEGQDKHHMVSFASVSGKQVEAAFDGGLPLAQAGITRRRIWSNRVMPMVNEYRHGTPCWVDLATTDLAGAKVFYAGLFGSAYVDEEMGEMHIGVYSMAMLDGSATADCEFTSSHPSESTPPAGRPLPRFHPICRLPWVQRARAVRYSGSPRRRQGCSTRRRHRKA